MPRAARLAPLVLVALAGCAGGATFEAAHAASEPADGAFVEVFRVTAVSGALESDALSFRLDGQPLEVEWRRAAERLAVGDEFSFRAEAFSVRRHLEALEEDRVVWEGHYAGGSAR